MGDSETATCYPTTKQYQQWKDEAEQMDMTISSWINAMVEAGRKKFDAHVEPDETADELRRQRNDLQDELERTRERVERLEQQLLQSERGKIQEFIQNNPGATYADICREVGETVPGRVTSHLDDMNGRSIHDEGDGYYPKE